MYGASAYQSMIFLFYILKGDIPLKVKMEQLEAPPLERLLRKVDECFVESLKLKLQQDPTGPGVPPLALLCKEEKDKEKFRVDLSGQYKFEVIGGLHSVEARKRLVEEYPGEGFDSDSIHALFPSC